VHLRRFLFIIFKDPMFIETAAVVKTGSGDGLTARSFKGDMKAIAAE
jgi:hypothetical protein